MGRRWKEGQRQVVDRISRLTDQLQTRLRAIDGELDRFRREPVDIENRGQHVADFSDTFSVEALRSMRADALSGARRAIEQLLAKLAGGAEIVCEDCGDLLTISRILASPGTERCVRCQSKHETDVRRMRTARGGARAYESVLRPGSPRKM
ncbi:TraR/DksA C4-type zinc finger protein [Candidatus Uhrbacteria bacterium]|nr:TraR/DksA C4-type zinc finger protein [Candidatus Uhrbacteria bacterium]